MKKGNSRRMWVRAVLAGVAVVALLALGACGPTTAGSPSSAGSQAAPAAVVAEGTGDAAFDEAFNAALAYAREADIAQGEGFEWEALSLARANDQASASALAGFADAMEQHVKASQGAISNHRSTDYSKAVLSLTAAGDDARDVAGYNLFEGLADLDFVTAQGVNGPIWALIAVDSKPEYDIPASQAANPCTREALLQAVLDGQGADGGWQLDAEGSGQGDVDLTAMALTALAPYYKDGTRDDVVAAVDTALAFLSSAQQPDGGFATKYGASSESASQVVIALCSLGIDPETDARFVKDGATPVANLLSFQDATGGFAHMAGQGGDDVASEQALCALVALYRLKLGQTAIYDLSAVATRDTV